MIGLDISCSNSNLGEIVHKSAIKRRGQNFWISLGPQILGVKVTSCVYPHPLSLSSTRWWWWWWCNTSPFLKEL